MCAANARRRVRYRGDSKPTLRLLLVINAVHVPLVFVLALGLGRTTRSGSPGQACRR